MAAFTDEQIAEIQQTCANHPEWGARRVAKELGWCGSDAVLKYRNGRQTTESFQPDTQPSEANEIKNDGWTISIPRTRICTLEQLVEHCKVDLSIWEVERFVCNKWEIGAKDHTFDRIIVEPLFQVKAYFRKNRVVEFAKVQVEKLRLQAANFSPKFPIIKARSSGKSGNLAEYSIYDHHFGALIWGKETGFADYDNRIAKECWEKGLTALVQRTRDYSPERALIILGNDQQNADNRAGTTERGTPQSMDSRYQKVFDISKNASIWAIDALLGEFGAVDVVIVPGNHDPLGAWHLGDTLSSWYRLSKQVTINNSPNPKKYYEHGVNMLMFTHGNNGKLESYDTTMAAEQPAMWGRTKWREAHTGDKHQRRLIELKGATVRILPSLRPPCAWTAENHFVGTIRAAESYVWNKNEGLIGTAVYSILEQ